MRIGKRLEVTSKHITCWLLARCFMYWGKRLGPDSVKSIQHVLFVRPNFRMGNMLLITPGFRAVRQQLPEAKIGFLTTSAYGHMLHHHSDLDYVHELTRAMTWKWWELFSFLRQIRKRRYDLVIDCSEGASLLGAAFVAFSGGRYRLGFEGGPNASLFNIRSPANDPDDHRIEKLLSLLSFVGIASEDQAMKLTLTQAHKNWASERWRHWEISEETPCVGINLGARGKKRWPLPCFDRVIRQLIDEQVQPILFVGPEELDCLSKMETQLPEQVIIDTTHDPSRFAALLNRCAAFLTCDTGPMHLAVAVGTPTVAIFRIHNFNLIGPLGPRHRTLFDPDGTRADAALDLILDLLNNAEGRDSEAVPRVKASC